MAWGDTNITSNGGNVTLGIRAGYDSVSRSGNTVYYTLWGAMGMGKDISGTTIYSQNGFCMWLPSGGTKRTVKAAYTNSQANHWYEDKVGQSRNVGTYDSSFYVTDGFAWNAWTPGAEKAWAGVSVSFPTPTAPSVSASHGSIDYRSAVIYGSVSSWGNYVSSGSTSLVYGTSTNYGNSTSSGATITGLKPNTTYYYKFTATNSAGLTSSATGSFTTLKPNPPSVSNVQVSNITPFTADVNFNASVGNGANASVLKYSLDSGSWVNLNVNARSFSLSNLTPEHKYYIKIMLEDDCGNSASSDTYFTTLADKYTKVITTEGVTKAKVYVITTSGKKEITKSKIKIL